MVVKWSSRLHIKLGSISTNICVERPVNVRSLSHPRPTRPQARWSIGTGPYLTGVCVAFSNRFKIKPVFEIKRTPNSTYLNAVLSKHLFKLSILRCFTHRVRFPHTYVHTHTPHDLASGFIITATDRTFNFFSLSTLTAFLFQ